MKKKRRRVRTRIKVIGVLLLGYILFFAFTSIYYRDKWYPNTTVNSIDVSNLTYNESKEEIANRVNNYKLEIIGKNDISFKINGKDIDLKATYEKNLEKSFSNHLDGRSLFGIFANHDYEVNLKITYNQDKLEKLINNSVLVNGSDDYKIEESIPDHVEYDEKTQTGKIVEGVNGNKLDIDEFKTIIKEALKDVQTKIDLTDKEAYPDVYEKSTNKNIEKQLSTYNSYLLNWITWDMGEGVTETITPDDIKDWLIIGDSGKVTLDKDEMSEWIEDFCLKYKTVGKSRHFTTHTGQVIEISGGDYGWRLDYDKIVEQVYDIITEKTDENLIKAYIENKNQEFAIKLFNKYHRSNHKSKLIIVGDGSLRNYLENLTKELNIGDNVIFTGVCSDIAELMHTFDVFLLPSKTEGFGIVAIEAQACGIPSIVSTGVPKLVDMNLGLIKFKDLDINSWLSLITKKKIQTNTSLLIGSMFDISVTVNEIEKIYSVK